MFFTVDPSWMVVLQLKGSGKRIYEAYWKLKNQEPPYEVHPETGRVRMPILTMFTIFGPHVDVPRGQLPFLEEFTFESPDEFTPTQVAETE